MSTLSPPSFRPSGAPEKSAALLALQERGLELPSRRKDSISPQSNTIFKDKPRLSPLSIISTPSDLDRPLDFFGDNEDRRPSAISFETEVSNILNLYMNSSKESLKSDYEEEVALESDDEEDDIEEERISVPSFHQPKAYRDTIAPLLEHQFSTLTVPAMPSPMSIASMPMLIHPNATQSVPSLNLTPDASPNLRTAYNTEAAVSGTSIQITPEMSPFMHSDSPKSQGYRSEVEIALEVPDVREADGWYDQPLSPVSPEDIHMALRDSQMSAVSPHTNEGYQRQLTFETLAPPQPQQSPNPRPVDYYEDVSLPVPSRAVVSEIIDNHMVPPPLDLSRCKSPVNLVTKSPPVQQATMHLIVDEDLAPKSRQASLVVSDPIEGPMRTYLTPPPPDRLTSTSPGSKITLTSDLDEIYRSGSAFSDSTVDSPVATAKFGKQLKKALRLGKRKKNKTAKKTKTEVEAAAPAPAPDKFTDDIESYKYGYWKSHALVRTRADTSLPPPQRILSPGMESVHKVNPQDDQKNRSSAGSGTVARTIPQPVRPTSRPDEWPMTRPTDQNWYEVNKQKKAHDSIGSQSSTGSTGYPAHMQKLQSQTAMSVGSNEVLEQPDHDRFSYHNRPASRTGRVHIASDSTSASRLSAEADSILRPNSAGYNNPRRSAGTPVSYNNDLFEASGGKKRSGFGSRLFMSAEEKRKLKVKESIVVVGGGKMAGRSGRDSAKALVNI